MPDIPGLHDFKGKLVHTARWDNSYDWKNKKVAVIGNGASGIQVVTHMQPKVRELTNYMRNPTWISINILADKTPEGKNFEYPEDQKSVWRNDPKAFYEYRKDLENSTNAFFFAMFLDHPVQKYIEGLCRDRMHESLRNDPELAKRFTPDYPAGCRRITPGDGYLEALQADNCRDCWDTIESITETGIRARNADGVVNEEQFDMIVCATGFDGSWLPQWKLVGRDGVTLEKQWSDHPEAFLATQVDGLPNYFMINGPNIPISHGSVIQQMSWTADYILRWVKRMSREDIRTLAVKKEAVADYNQYQQELLKRTVWSADCRAFYKNGKIQGNVSGVYGGSMMHFKTALERAGGEHMEISWRSGNRFRCLGNGTVESDQGGAGDLAPYF